MLNCSLQSTNAEVSQNEQSEDFTECKVKLRDSERVLQCNFGIIHFVINVQEYRPNLMMAFVNVAKKVCNGFANMLIRSNGETKMTKM